MKSDQTPWRRAWCTPRIQALSKPLLSCLAFEELLYCWKIHKREQIKHWWFGSPIHHHHPPPPPPSLQVNNLCVNINNAVSSICSITRAMVRRTNESGHRRDSAGARSRLRRARALSITTHHSKYSLIAEKRDEILTDAHHPSVGESSAVTY